MRTMPINFMRPWTVIHPTVTRYLNKAFVDDFFATGRLRLTTFSQFRQYKDEQRGDILEGRISAELESTNGTHSVMMIVGQPAYVLCGSLVESEHIAASFSTKAAIRILDIVGFAELVSRHIPGFAGGIQGNCIYRDDPVLRKSIPFTFTPPKNHEEGERMGEELDRMTSRETIEALFIKRLKYAEQNEYRLIWFASGPEVSEPLFVTCPEARQLCQRI